MLYLLLLIPALTAVACFLPLNTRWWERFNVVGSILTGTAALYISLQTLQAGSPLWPGRFLMVDQLSAVLVFIIGVIGTICCLYTVTYLRADRANGEMDSRKTGWFFGLVQLFVGTMYLAVLADNLGVMWVAIEGTTIVSALLVGFYGTRTSLEAAWKYIIICTVGIAFAMLGIILTFHAARGVLGAEEISLSWRFLYPVASSLNPNLMKLAFVFVLVGYGTKAGLFPMHTWLPDAHSQAPSPVSALLSGVLLNCAIYAIIRFHLLASATGDFSGRLLVLFGIMSMVGALPFILVQKDIKRLLAYSSVEHIGIIVLGVGLGGTLGYTGALLHMVNHALGKSVLFLSAGTLTQSYHSKLIPRIKGIGQLLPITSAIFMASLLAIGGSPPFGLFISELNVATRGFEASGPVLGFIFLMVVAVVFTGMIYFAGKMYFSNLPSRFPRGERFSAAHALMLLPICLLVLQGVYMPGMVQSMLSKVVSYMIAGGVN
ncbi:MAG: NADH-ubiquinone oxidoreductase [Peptococcaceae bacterium BICA1-7]|nr:MAG: NADH-ubiquinone oxidoreductase [Peptococcaceae bacterium BICA1-7]HBV98329.1 hydrogenase 4 subunit F [Desulfotomaculum sp.]